MPPMLFQSSPAAAPAGLAAILAAIGGLFLLALGFIVLLLFSQRRVMEAARQRGEAQQRLLEAAAAGGLVLWTCDGEKPGLAIGDTARTLLGDLPASLEDLLGRVVEADRAAARALLQESNAGGHPPRLLRMLHLDGRQLDTQWQVRRRGGRLEGVLRDVTRESQLQAQLLQSQKLEAVGTLVSGVSHEFGNLLAVVDACADLLVRSPDLPADAGEAARHIQDAALRGKELIRQLTAFTRRGPGETSLESPVRLLEEMQRLLGPLFGRRVRVEVQADPALPPHPLNRAQILQALLNLCLNARDAMPEGGRVRLRAGAGDRPGDLVLEVEDQGPGVPMELRSRVFEPFFTTKAPGKGTGLGLAMTHGIVQAHGGTLICEEAEGGGAKFRMVLPGGKDAASPQGSRRNE